MIKYFQTTTLILLWCFGLTLLYGYGVFWLVSKKLRVGPVLPGSTALLPALMLAPLSIVVMFRLFEINLLFPVHFFTDFAVIAICALAPALVLLIASGLLGSITSSIRREYAHWSCKPFALLGQCMGKPPSSSLRRIVLLKSLSGAWSRCLPWLFGELIVVETVFNAQGLGLDAWHLAKVRDFEGLAEAIFWLVALYGACVLFSALANRWLGRRLETYF